MTESTLTNAPGVVDSPHFLVLVPSEPPSTNTALGTLGYFPEVTCTLTHLCYIKLHASMPRFPAHPCLVAPAHRLPESSPSRYWERRSTSSSQPCLPISRSSPILKYSALSCPARRRLNRWYLYSLWASASLVMIQWPSRCLA
ncbi:hypothetical protein OE88DRAFT_1533248 [Heliocybe sulcata]|uniref:Uncharacterized protein n=1 Tax=Heliocybe sulcata TaxID=5364 RepID=A0A5C3N283_9AGAM|nr:hypothetical protein OE88DRAFT_1533248 [Heliocybe sulcata]